MTPPGGIGCSSPAEHADLSQSYCKVEILFAMHNLDGCITGCNAVRRLAASEAATGLGVQKVKIQQRFEVALHRDSTWKP